MIQKDSSSFFWKLLWSFLFVGLMPALIISFVTVRQTTRFIDISYKQGVKKAVEAAEGFSRYLLSEAERLSTIISLNPNIINYMGNHKEENKNLQQITSLIKDVNNTDYYTIFIVPLNEAIPVLCAKPSSTYQNRENLKIKPHLDKMYEKWSLVPSLAVSTDQSGYTFTHLNSDIIISIGMPVYYNEQLCGFVITDITRKAFSDFLGLNISRMGTLNALFLLDSDDCIIYSLVDSGKEGSFIKDIYVDKTQYISTTRFLSSTLSLYGTYPVSVSLEFSSKLASLIFTISLFTILFALSCTLLFTRLISSPVACLTSAMRQVESGNLQIRCQIPARVTQKKFVQDDLFFLMSRFNIMLDRIEVLMEEAILKQKYLRSAEVQALQSQINPHFLYNTLSSIRSMAKLQGAEDVAEMVTTLARILREGICAGEDISTIGASLKLAEDYFKIESFRWEGRFTLINNIDPGLYDLPIPKLVIQPIVENALVHGLEQKSGPGTLIIEGELKDKEIILRVIDDGYGMSQKTLEHIQERLEQGTSDIEHVTISSSNTTTSSGIALINTHRRLRLLYGKESGLRIFTWPREGTCVEIHYTLERIE
jgi:two-component system sensor histidine kinase YesM